MAKIFVPFINDRQEKELWCWAAVSANVYNSALQLQDPAKKEQCAVVQAVKGGDPCTHRNSFNDPGTADKGLTVLGMRDDLPDDSHLNIDFLVGELTPVNQSDPEGEPVCAEVLWDDNGTHFVAVSAVNPENKTVFVEDPYLGPGNTVEYRFQQFLDHYGAKDPKSVPGHRRGTVQTFQKVKREPGP